MKSWINVAEQQPLGENVVIRDIHSKVCMDWMYIRRITPEFITATINEEFGDEDFPSNEYEWLDESYQQICCLYEIQAKRVHDGEISLEEYLEICFPDKFTKGYQIVQVLPGSKIIPPIENPIQEVAPGLFKIGNAYTGQAGADLMNEQIRNLFRGNPLDYKK